MMVGIWIEEMNNPLIAMLRENKSLGFMTRSNTNQAVQQKKIVRGLKFRI